MGIALLPAQARNSHYRGAVFQWVADKSPHLELKIAATCRSGDCPFTVSAMTSVISKTGGQLSRT
jgi:hypothetical protein